MRLRHIEVLHAIYTSGSITQAAKLLNVSQPSVSKVLAHAEQQAGFQFFDRSGGKLVATPEVERLMPHVTEVFEDLNRVKRVAGNLREAAEGKVRIACTPALGIEFVPEVVANFVSQHPGVYFEIDTLHIDEIREALRESRTDVAFAFDPPAMPGFAADEIATGRFVVIAPIRLAKKLGTPVALAELVNKPFIRLNSRGPLGQLLDAHLSAMPEPPDVVAATETYHVAKSLVARGMGIAVVDEVTARSGPQDDIRILPMAPEIDFRISAVRVDGALPLICKRFVDHAREAFRHRLRV